MDALIIVDVQNDFLPGGSLAVNDGNAVIPIANQLISVVPITVATQDWHPSDHGSFASNHTGLQPGDEIELAGVTQILWPDHCVQGTTGADLTSELDTAQIKRIIQKGMDPLIDSYSGFFDNNHRRSTGLSDYLKEKGVTRVHIMGLATDYCVKFTVLDSLELGFETWLIQDGCRGVDLHQGDIAESLREMEAAGAMLTDCNRVIQSLPKRN